MASEIDAVVAGLKQDIRQQLAGQPRRRKKKVAVVSEAEQIRRFLGGAERSRLESGEISHVEWQQYQAAMLDKLEKLGALEV